MGWYGLSAVFRFRLVLCLIAGGLAAWVIFAAEKPWTAETANRERWKLDQIVDYYSFWAAVGNLGVLVVLIFTAGWWAAPKPAQCPPPAARSPRWFWPFILAAMIFCGVAAAKRMNYGFVHDEDYSARRVIAGSYKIGADGKVSLGKLRWRETLYYYRKPNNHILHSVLGRLCWTGWLAVAPPVKWHMKEWVIRIPAWVGGVGAVCMLGVLLRRHFSPLTGALAAWLLALHPWHIRFTSEARGYSLLLCVIPVVLYFWLRAIRENEWRWWLLLSASQFAMVYCYPGAAYVLVVLNGATGAWLLHQVVRYGESPAAGRWFASNCFAAMAGVQLMLPLVPQLQSYMKTEEARVPLPPSWIGNTAAHFLSGVPWSKSNLNFPFPEVLPYAMSHPVFLAGLLIGIFGLLVLGYVALFLRPWPEGPIVAATLLVPGFLGFAVAKLLQQWLFEWYIIYLLPGLVAGVAVGAAVGGRWLAAKSRIGSLEALPGLALVFSYGIFSQPFRSWFCTHPMEPVKEAVLAIRGTLDPNDPKQRDLLTGILLSPDDYYDPHARLIKTPEDFMNLLQTADEQNKPLYIMVPHPRVAAFKVPKLWRLFNESGLFTSYLYFRGLDQTNDRVVALYAPGSARNFNLEAFLRGRETVPDTDKPPLEFPSKPVVYPTTETRRFLSPATPVTLGWAARRIDDGLIIPTTKIWHFRRDPLAHRLPLFNVLLENAFQPTRIQPSIPDAVRIHDQPGAALADSQAGRFRAKDGYGKFARFRFEQLPHHCAFG
ncbi:MAG TPA: glycosyltransferase family 39 protein [Terrimicrobiaceae bacterium]